jgi:pyruvate/2-oxoglutarate dehydrogenase complex dihydrolipoamide acyltransferase (E2) component
MADLIEVKVPDIGDFKDVPIIDVLVRLGDRVKAEDALITLESDKASMDVPSPLDGVVKELKVKVGDKVSEGSLILIAEAEAAPAGVAPREKVKGGGQASGEGAPVADYGSRRKIRSLRSSRTKPPWRCRRRRRARSRT